MTTTSAAASTIVDTSVSPMGDILTPTVSTATVGIEGANNLILNRGDVDPYWTPCPPWCLESTTRHGVEAHDCDRYHFGDLYHLPIRDLTAEHHAGGDSYTLGHAQMYLRHYVTAMAPEIQVDLNGSSVGVALTLDEAEAIGRTLLAMVEAAR